MIEIVCAFASHEVAVLTREKITIFNEENKAKYGKQKRKLFAEGMIEIEKVMNGEIQVDHEKLLMDQMEATKSSEMTPLALINRIRGRKRKNAHSPVVKTQKAQKESTIDDSTKVEDKEVIEDLKAKLALREQQIDLLEKQ